MARSSRTPRTVLLLSILSVLASACDHSRGNPLGPLDEQRDRDQTPPDEPHAYVAPIDLELEWALDNRLVPASQASELIARIRIEAPDKLDLPRPPARVVLVVDTSASMKGEAIEGAKRAAAELVDSLADGDSFSLVVFHSRAEVLLSATVIGDESRAAARAEIERMQAWGTTDLAGGLRAALSQLDMVPTSMAAPDPETGLVPAGVGVWAQAGPDPQVLERVVLLGDGVPNEAASIATLAQQFAARRAEITALGYGLEYDEVLLASLAEQTHGHFRFVEEPDAVAALFRDEVLHIQRTVASDLRLGMALGPGVRLTEVVGHPSQWNAGLGRHEILLGSISEGQTHELIVRLEVGPHNADATIELSDLELGFRDVYTGTGDRFERGFLAATASADPAAVESGRDLDIVRASARARINAATLEVLALARNGQGDRAKSLLADSVKYAKAMANSLSDPELAEQAEQLAALAPELAALARVQPQPEPVAINEVGNPAGTPVSDDRFAPAPQQQPQAFPAQPSPAASRKIKAAHSKAYNGLHD